MRRFPAILLIGLAALAACKKTPGHVIPEDDMAELLADMHEGEAVVELHPSAFASDSVKRALKQSILMRNGVTQEQFDTSLVWYGHNLDIYNDVYEHTVEILEERQKRAQKEAREAGERLVAAGDSVDIWQLPHCLLLDRRQVGDVAQIAFSYPLEGETERGDRFVWKLTTLNAKRPAKMLMGVDYADGSSEFQLKDAMPGLLADVVLQSDSNRTVTRLYGYMTYRIEQETAVMVNGVTLARTRLNPDNYSKHPYQKKAK